MAIKIKRVYEPPSGDDGYRVMVDRLWPRGVGRDAAAVDAWLPEIAPTADLRRWFGHRPERWEEFRDRYRQELQGAGELVAALRDRAARGPVTLIYGARDPQHNNAVVLRQVLEDAAAGSTP
jgi:uncharacterized protein YeaO (DUF488 family)